MCRQGDAGHQRAVDERARPGGALRCFMLRGLAPSSDAAEQAVGDEGDQHEIQGARRARERVEGSDHDPLMPAGREADAATKRERNGGLPSLCHHRSHPRDSGIRVEVDARALSECDRVGRQGGRLNSVQLDAHCGAALGRDQQRLLDVFRIVRDDAPALPQQPVATVRCGPHVLGQDHLAVDLFPSSQQYTANASRLESGRLSFEGQLVAHEQCLDTRGAFDQAAPRLSWARLPV